MNQQALLKKVRQMQQEIVDLQKHIDESDFVASSGGVVSVTLKGTKKLVSVKISDEFVIESKEDIEMLEEMITSACSKAYADIEKTTNEKMAKYQSFLNQMGGMF